jgi:dTDP-4-dehydrorhamnose reductase
MTFKNIVVTGATGMLGRDLVPFLRDKGYLVSPVNSSSFSLLSTAEHMQEQLEPFSPQVIIHCAAYTGVDQAENEPELAMAVNKDGTRKLAETARALDAILMYVSSDYVFDGLAHEPYRPEDRPNPISTYGLSKYYGELMVSELLDTYYVVRTSWLYGIQKRNFVQWVLETARTGGTVQVATDWIGTPTWTGSLCMALETIMQSGAYGIYHAADIGAISRYEQARAICRAAGLSDEHVQPVSTASLNLQAARPAYSPLACPDLAMPSWETSLQAYLEQYRQQVLEPS